DGTAVVYAEPTLAVPAHRRKERLSADVVVPWRGGTNTEQYHPPLPLLGLHQISVTCRLDRMLWQMLVRQNGVVRVRLERAPRRARTRHSYLMPVARSTFGDQEIVPTRALVQVRPLRPDIASALPGAPRHILQVARAHIDLGLK